MHVLALTLLLLSAACQQQVSAPPPATKPASASPPAPASALPPGWSSEQEACVDRSLAAHGLDAYGSPQGTMYSGGTPLFDEATGHTTPRQAFLARRSPDVLRGCGLQP